MREVRYEDRVDKSEHNTKVEQTPNKKKKGRKQLLKEIAELKKENGWMSGELLQIHIDFVRLNDILEGNFHPDKKLDVIETVVDNYFGRVSRDD